MPFTQHEGHQHLVLAEEVLSLDERLCEAVTKHNVEAVLKYIDEGADVNYKKSPKNFSTNVDFEHQPYSPLRLVVFCISNSCLTVADHVDFRNIAYALCQVGADAINAMELASIRYGKDCGEGDEDDAIHLIARFAKRQKQSQ